MGERLFMLVDADVGGQVYGSCASLCERCAVLDPAQTMRVYLEAARNAARATELGATSYVCHRNGTEIRYGSRAELGAIARMRWSGRVDYCEVNDATYRWHR